MDLEDILILLGVVLVALGVALIYLPAGIIALGGGLLGLSLIVTKRTAKSGGSG